MSWNEYYDRYILSVLERAPTSYIRVLEVTKKLKDPTHANIIESMGNGWEAVFINGQEPAYGELFEHYRKRQLPLPTDEHQEEFSYINSILGTVPLTHLIPKFLEKLGHLYKTNEQYAIKLHTTMVEFGSVEELVDVQFSGVSGDIQEPAIKFYGSELVAWPNKIDFILDYGVIEEASPSKINNISITREGPSSFFYVKNLENLSAL